VLIVLGLVLFGAGVRWKSKRSAELPIASTTTAAEQLVAAKSGRTGRSRIVP
jgi:hypothetical protein